MRSLAATASNSPMRPHKPTPQTLPCGVYNALTSPVSERTASCMVPLLMPAGSPPMSSPQACAGKMEGRVRANLPNMRQSIQQKWLAQQQLLNFFKADCRSLTMSNPIAWQMASNTAGVQTVPLQGMGRWGEQCSSWIRVFSNHGAEH